MSMAPSSVISEVAYVNDEWRDRREMPRIYSRQSRRQNTSLREVEIHDARPGNQAGAFTLEANGFVMVDHKSAFAEFDSKERVLAEYFPEAEELLLSVTGAVAALPFPFYQVRTREPEHFFDAYSLYMHCDYSMSSCAGLSKSIFKINDQVGAYPPEDWHYVFYNLWRAVDYPAERDPLVWVDAGSVDPADIIDYSPVKDQGKGAAAVPVYNSRHQHYYMPDLRPDEVVILKQLDSRPERIQVSPHTSFVDPEAAPDARPRRSIDIRFMCLFPKTGEDQ